MDHERIAVVGGGTMGAGIAQAALAAGFPVTLCDVSEAVLGRARQRIADGLAKQGLPDAAERLSITNDRAALAGAALVIEAAPEQFDLKRELFAELGAICPPPCIIASNTSSLPIAALSAACPGPERVAGLHFFNPVHRMALVEVVRAPATDDATVAALLLIMERMGKTAVLARDTPGFVVNRVARPFYGEALRMLGEGLASHETIDIALQRAGGFPLGPFALMDLIGIDINFAVTRSMYEQSFGEPRYRPHPIQQQKVYAGELGRKTGRGFYRYEGGQPGASQPEPPPAPLDPPPSVLFGTGTWAPGLAELCDAAGMNRLVELPFRPTDIHAGVVVAGRDEGALDQAMILDRQMPASSPLFVQCADITAAEVAGVLSHPERLIGFDGLFTDGALTLAATPLLSADARQRAEAIVRGLGRAPLWVADRPGLIVPRVVAMLANEAAFALGESVADAVTIDTAMRLGANHPAGPLARAEQIGYGKIVALLDHLRAEYGEERYRVAPLLRQAARIGSL